MQSKRWCFIIDNYTDADTDLLRSIDAKYIVFGKETGSSGIPLLQGFVTFKTMKRLSGVRKLHTTAHWAMPHSTSKEASNYCKKDGDYEEIGSVPFPGKRTDLVQETVSAAKKHKRLHDFIYTNYPPTKPIVNPYRKSK